jgi:hypothetical protein
MRGANERLRQFVDAQLLISAHTTSGYAESCSGAAISALYGASALDLPRRAVVHLEGGIGAIAQSLAQEIATFVPERRQLWSARMAERSTIANRRTASSSRTGGRVGAGGDASNIPALHPP